MTIFSGVGAAGTIGAASGSKVLAASLTTTPGIVLGADPARQNITFHNPGAIDIFVAPTTIAFSPNPATGVTTITGPDPALVPSVAAPQGCFVVYANGGTIVIAGECQKAWQAFSRTATAPLTIMTSAI
jgi:hypothetical protein